MNNSQTTNQPSATVVIDAKGDLVKGVLAGLATVCPQSLSRVYWLDPFDQLDGKHAPFAFNLCHLARGNTPLTVTALQLAEMVSTLSTQSGTARSLGTGSRQKDLLFHLLLGAMACDHPEASPLWSLDALLLKGGMKRLAHHTRSHRARQFLYNTYTLSDELKASTASRLRMAFGITDQTEAMMAADHCIQIDDLIAPGAITLLAAGNPYGGMVSQQEYWCSCFVRLIAERLLERPSPFPGHFCRLIVDEAQIPAQVLADVAEHLLSTGRSRAIALTIMSQSTVLLAEASRTLPRLMLANSPHKIVGRMEVKDCELFAKEQAPAPGTEQSLSSLRQNLVASLTNLPDREFYYFTPGNRQRFRTVDVNIAGWNKAAEKLQDDLDRVRSRLAIPLPDQPRTILPPVAQGRKPKRQPSTAKPSTTKWG